MRYLLKISIAFLIFVGERQSLIVFMKKIFMTNYEVVISKEDADRVIEILNK